eukprot:TRINITY_DN1227_c0_g2_i1.p1 TRINITY_DN1227_c0_g2~~TRINITY_DN1227_c0_g2_i1.p1  ORF type:complete len:568 (-),score=105.64 TRINITY_DN1227_c0_g2_i1:160-1863(-)
MCIRDRYQRRVHGDNGGFRNFKISDLEEPEVEVEVESKDNSITKVYFQNKPNWDKVCVYAYKPATSESVKDWPGVTAQKESDDLYSYSLPKGFEGATVIFNNGNNGQQTENLETKIGHSMMYDDESKSLKSMSKVYFKNISDWEKIRVHYWQDGGSGTTWPGDSLVYYGNGLYGFEMPEGYQIANVIFNNNNNGKQTETVKINDGETMILDSNNTWREFTEDDVLDLNKEDKDEIEADNNKEELTKAYFYNSDNWNDIKIYVYTENNDGSSVKEIETWPGVDLISEGENLYSYILPKGFKDSVLIFNGYVYEKEKTEVKTDEATGSAVEVVEQDVKKNKQTKNLKIKSGQIMIYKNAQWVEYKDKDKDKSEKKDNGNTLEDKQKLKKTITGTSSRSRRKKKKSIKKEKAVNQNEISQNDNNTKKKEELKLNGWSLTNNNQWKYIENGNVSIGWKKVNERWYMLDRVTGMMRIGWFKDLDSSWYYLDPKSGSMLTGWFQDIDGKWYYLNNSGKMGIGWIKDTDGKWYYLYGNGSMAFNTCIDGYHLGVNGEWISQGTIKKNNNSLGNQ